MRTLVIVLMAFGCFCVNAWAMNEKGLVLYYPFDEGSGNVVDDKSGNGNDGKMAGGVKWVKGLFGSALEFDGKDDYVDCGGNKSLNIGSGGSVLFWFKPLSACQGGLVGWTTGAGRPDQRLVVSLNTYMEERIDGNLLRKELGVYISDGQHFDRPFVSNFHKPYFPLADQWIFYTVTFDGRALDIYRDGVLVETRFQTLVPDTRDVPLWIGRCLGMGGPSDFFKGLIDEVRIYNRPVSEQEVYQVYMQTAQGREKDISGFGSIGIKPLVMPKPGTIFADLDYRGLDPTVNRVEIKAELLDAQGKKVCSGTVKMLPAWGRAEVVLDASNLPAGQYTVRAAADRGKSSTTSVKWPGRAKGWEKVKILNNFCWELLNESPRNNPKSEYTFTNPRRGWVYFVTEAEGGLSLNVRGATPEVIHAPDKGAKQEVMRWMEQGAQTIAVSGNGTLKTLVVRSVPILFFHHYPHVGPGTGNDSDFLVKHVLSPYNTILTHNYDATCNPGEFRQKWASELGRHVFDQIYPATHLEWSKKLKDDTARQQIWDYVAPSAGLNKPEFQGVVLDEFAAGDDRIMWTKSYYDEWTEVCAKILEDPKYAGRFIIPFYGYNMFDFKKSSAFLRMFVERGSYLFDELYLDERDTEERAWLYINEILADLMDERERAVPGSTERTGATLSYLQREPWNSAVDFKVHLEMQFEHLATRPEFFGLGGVGAWSSYGCNNEEYVRWVSKLCRYYGLEGNTDRLSTDPYTVAQIRNADFIDGTEGWMLQPAEKDSMVVKSHKGYGTLQERYSYRPWTDTPFLWTKRSAQKPNLFSQQIQNLEPGRLYLVRLWIGDYQGLITGTSKDEERAVSIRVDGGELWNDWYRTKLFDGNVYTFASYLLAPFGGQNLYYFKIHQFIFRAKAPTATLSISDWKSEKEPGGPIGQELMFNFIDVHPYLEY